MYPNENAAERKQDGPDKKQNQSRVAVPQLKINKESKGKRGGRMPRKETKILGILKGAHQAFQLRLVVGTQSPNQDFG